MLRLADLTSRADFRIGDLHVSPARRLVEGPGGIHHVEPQMMLVFLRLLAGEDQVVSRNQLFDDCWGHSSVGDDSLNRAIAGVRQIPKAVGSTAFELETIPRTGYVLRRSAGTAGPGSANAELERRVAQALDCWRSGLPIADLQVIAEFEEVLWRTPGSARGWGTLALLLRKAVEYAPPDHCAELLQRCEAAVRQALLLDPRQSDARVALAGVIPLFGNWLAARQRLLEVLADDPGHGPAQHDLAVLEMATGRPSAAGPLIERLVAADPLAATLYYKRIYHLWTFGELDGLERVATRALQLWPKHPAIWVARFWTLVFTERPEQARLLVLDEQVRPPMPSPVLQLLARVCVVRGGGASDEEREDLVEQSTLLASRGPALAVTALLSLMALDSAARALDVAYAYYLGRGRLTTPIWGGNEDPRVTDQSRRITQLLFLPCAAPLRALRGFDELCRDLGLLAYWEEAGLVPDFRAGGR